MASSSSKYRPKVRKDKSTAMEDEAPLQKGPTVEDVLDQKRYFSTVKQMENYGNHFYHRRIIEPKIMNLESFMDSGLYFHQHLLFQGLSNYVTLSYSYFPELIKVFYANLQIPGNGYLMSEVSKKKIKLKPSDWFQICGLKYQGRKLSLPEVPPDMNYNRDMALASMVRPGARFKAVKTVGVLQINDRLLQYVIVYFLTPRMTNISHVLQDDIFMIWALKNDILINWPHVIMQNMLKCKSTETSLPYGILITTIMQYVGVDLSVDTTTTVSLRHQFSVQNLRKMNIVHVNGEWQQLRGRSVDAPQRREESPMDEDSDDGDNNREENMVEPPNPIAEQLLTQIWGGVQSIEARLQTLTIDVDRRFNEVNSTVNQIYDLLNGDEDSDE